MQSPATRLQAAIEHVAHLLPTQGPITSFVHHNTLHALEHLPFDEAVQTGAEMVGCEPYLPEQEFRKELSAGRIRIDDIKAVLREDLGAQADEPLLHFCTRLQLRLAMLEHPLLVGTPAELHWFVFETDGLRRFAEHVSREAAEKTVQETRHWAMRDLALADTRPAAHAPDEPRESAPLDNLFKRFDRASMEQWSDATWHAFTLQALGHICRDAARRAGPAPARHSSAPRHRDLLLKATGHDSDLLVHEVLIPFCGSYVDQGVSRWSLPERERGFFQAFCALYKQRHWGLDRWLRGLPEELARLVEQRVTPIESLLESLAQLGVPEDEWEPFLTKTLLALRGWAGMIWQLQLRDGQVLHPIADDSLTGYLAIRLILERYALAHLASASLPEWRGECRDLRTALQQYAAPQAATVDERAFLVFQVAQVLGWLPRDLDRLSQSQWTQLLREIEAFDELERRRIYQHAYDRQYRIETLDAVATHAAAPVLQRGRPQFQAVFCLDEREESFRRHLEEVAPNVETYAAAGFYGVAMYYRGAADAHFAPLCPVVIQPKHWVVEDVDLTEEEQHRRNVHARRALGSLLHGIHVATRTFFGGLFTALLGVLVSVPMVARVIFPRLTSLLRKTFGRLVAPPRHTQLQVERSAPAASSEREGIGYTIDEMTGIVECLLRDIGLIRNMSRLVFIVGHGSSSLNNPHEPAHDCGACGGARGGPNARAFAQMANDVRVRRQLEQRGLSIPADTVFIGGYHNTCDESLTLFDLERSPLSHKNDLLAARTIWRTVRERNAHERCRRFDTAPLSISEEDALRHVEARAEDLAQTRPEYGHCTNAVCFVGRRQRTRGLYMDRRTFLTSYDPTQDDEQGAILARILAAAVPVCAGISLEYYFSRVDSPGWGCGTKLPHNITGLLGIMDGAASDLRTGLPWQMVELHEPVRILFIIESTAEVMLGIMNSNQGIGRLCRNDWIQLAVLDPNSGDIELFNGQQFEPYQVENDRLPRAKCSASWYRGWRDHLGYAVIGPGGEEEPC